METVPSSLEVLLDGAKPCGPGCLETQREGMQSHIGKNYQTVKDMEVFNLADDGAGDEVLSGESEILSLSQFHCFLGL